MNGVSDPYYALLLIERRLCILERNQAAICSPIEIVDFYIDIDVVSKPCTRFIVVLVDSSNNNDMSLYMNINGEVKFIQTIAQ